MKLKSISILLLLIAVVFSSSDGFCKRGKSKKAIKESSISKQVRTFYDGFAGKFTHSSRVLTLANNVGFMIEKIEREGGDETYLFTIISESKNWIALYDKKTFLLIDNQRFAFGEGSRGGSTGSGYVKEFVVYSIKEEVLVDIINSTDTQGKAFDHFVFKISDFHKQVIAEVISRNNLKAGEVILHKYRKLENSQGKTKQIEN